MLRTVNTREQRIRRAGRSRAKLVGTAAKPRVTVFRSSLAVYAQAIDDVNSKTLAQANLSETGAKNTVEGAQNVGKLLADRLVALKITTAIFDRSGYQYHGKVKAVAEGLRSGTITC